MLCWKNNNDEPARSTRKNKLDAGNKIGVQFANSKKIFNRTLINNRKISLSTYDRYNIINKNRSKRNSKTKPLLSYKKQFQQLSSSLSSWFLLRFLLRSWSPFLLLLQPSHLFLQLFYLQSELLRSFCLCHDYLF